MTMKVVRVKQETDFLLSSTDLRIRERVSAPRQEESATNIFWDLWADGRHFARLRWRHGEHPGTLSEYISLTLLCPSCSRRMRVPVAVARARCVKCEVSLPWEWSWTAYFSDEQDGKAKLAERFEYLLSEVLVAIATDGMENASVEYRQAAVAALIKEKQELHGWTFTFLAANQDAVLTAKGLNIGEESVITYNASPAGMANVIASLSTYTSAVRSGAVARYSASDRNAAMEK